jgi:hypothetical protein
VERLLAPLALDITGSSFGAPSDTMIYTVSFGSPLDPADRTYLTQDYLVENDIIVRIWVRATDSGRYSISEVLTSYGMPSEVLVRTFKGQQEGARPMYLVLMYSNVGFAAVYASNAYHTGNSDIIEACWRDGPELTTWASDNHLEFRDLAKPNVSQIAPDEIKYYRPWDYATSESLDQFIEAARNANYAPCLQTHTELWP